MPKFTCNFTLCSSAVKWLRDLQISGPNRLLHCVWHQQHSLTVFPPAGPAKAAGIRKSSPCCYASPPWCPVKTQCATADHVPRCLPRKKCALRWHTLLVWTATKDHSYARTPGISRASLLPGDLQQIRGSKSTSGNWRRRGEGCMVYNSWGLVTAQLHALPFWNYPIFFTAEP